MTTTSFVITLIGSSTIFVAVSFMPGRSSIAESFLPSTSNMNPDGTSYCVSCPLGVSRVTMMLVGEAQNTVPCVIVVVRLTSGVSVVVAVDVSTVPSLSSSRVSGTPSMMAFLPGSTL